RRVSRMSSRMTRTAVEVVREIGSQLARRIGSPRRRMRWMVMRPILCFGAGITRERLVVVGDTNWDGKTEGRKDGRRGCCQGRHPGWRVGSVGYQRDANCLGLNGLGIRTKIPQKV